MLLAVFALLGTGMSASAQAVKSSLGGSVSLQWTDYQHRGPGEEIDGSSFVQQYSLLHQSRGIINNGRAGRWNVGLGYEWNSLDSELGEADFDETVGKILYNGEILFAPGGLPLRIHAYSRDLTQSRPIEEYTNFGNLIGPGIATTIHNGQHITTGLTLLAGIKNGTYRGDYRDLLSRFPRLMIDYHEDIVRDTNRRNPVDYRMRDLAFISLNKKDNWFHYRLQEYTDKLDSQNNFREKTFTIGTIDHLYRRQWINLTNWVKISVDASLVQYEEGENAWANTDTYAFNLFSHARRRNLDVSNYASFRRTMSESDESSSIYFPVYASGAHGPETKWRLFLLGEKTDERSFDSAAEESSVDVVYGKYQLETNAPGGYVLMPELELEANRSTAESGNAARAGIEARSDRRYRQQYDWLARYSVLYIDGESRREEPVSYWEQSALVSYERRLDSRTSIGGSQELLVGSGDHNGRATRHINSRGLPVSVANGQGDDAAASGDVFGSVTMAYVDILGGNRLANRFEAGFAYGQEGSQSAYALTLRHRMTYDAGSYSLRMTNEFTEADHGSVGGIEMNDELANPRTASDGGQTFRHRTSLRHRPNRSWETLLNLEAGWAAGDGGDVWAIDVEQETRYSLWNRGGFRRKILEVYERFDFELTSGLLSTWYSRLELGVDYSPFRRVTFGGSVSLEHFDQSDNTYLGGELYAALDYDKFRTKAHYEYKHLENPDLPEKIRDSRLTLNVQRLF